MTVQQAPPEIRVHEWRAIALSSAGGGASFEAATYADKAMDSILPEDMNIYERDSARGATSGGAAYTAYGGLNRE